MPRVIRNQIDWNTWCNYCKEGHHKLVKKRGYTRKCSCNCGHLGTTGEI